MSTQHLTPRELQVLTLLANGKHNKEIATALNISEHTAKFHVNSVLLKTKQTTRLGAVIACIKLGLLNIKDLMPEINLAIAKGEIAVILNSNVVKIIPGSADHMKENILEDIMESVDKLSMDFGNEQLEAEIKETLDVYLPNA